MKDSSSFSGAINSDGAGGDIYVEIEDGSTWTLTGDSYITSLTCSAGSINLNGHKLYVDGEEYAEGTASEGEAIVVETTSSGGHGGHGGGTPPEKPGNGSGGPGGPGGDGSEPPAKPEGDNGEPPAKPGE